MNIKLMECVAVGAAALTGCSSMTPIAAAPALAQQAVAQSNAGAVDYARIAAVKKNTRHLGVQVIWLRELALR